MDHKINSRIELSKASLRLREKAEALHSSIQLLLGASGMKNQKTKRSKRQYQTSSDLTKYYTDDPAATYSTKQDDVRTDKAAEPPAD